MLNSELSSSAVSVRMEADTKICVYDVLEISEFNFFFSSIRCVSSKKRTHPIKNLHPSRPIVRSTMYIQNITQSHMKFKASYRWSFICTLLNTHSHLSSFLPPRSHTSILSQHTYLLGTVQKMEKTSLKFREYCRFYKNANVFFVPLYRIATLPLLIDARRSKANSSQYYSIRLHRKQWMEDKHLTEAIKYPGQRRQKKKKKNRTERKTRKRFDWTKVSSWTRQLHIQLPNAIICDGYYGWPKVQHCHVIDIYLTNNNEHLHTMHSMQFFVMSECVCVLLFGW